MEKEYMGTTGHSDSVGGVGSTGVGPSYSPVGCTGGVRPSYNPADDRIDEMIRLLRSIDESVKQINAKLK